MRRHDALAVGSFFVLAAAIAACSGRYEGVDPGSAQASADGGQEASGECTAIQGCGVTPPAGDASDARSTPPSPTTPPSPPTPTNDAGAATNPAGCPSTPPVAGDICHHNHIACAWKTSCSDTRCTCEALGNGPASWQCSGNDACAGDGGH